METSSANKPEGVTSTLANEQVQEILGWVETAEADPILIEMGIGGCFISVGNSFQRMMSADTTLAILSHLANNFARHLEQQRTEER